MLLGRELLVYFQYFQTAKFFCSTISSPNILQVFLTMICVYVDEKQSKGFYIPFTVAREGVIGVCFQDVFKQLNLPFFSIWSLVMSI